MCLVRMMTFNIRGAFHPEDGVNAWEHRAPLNVKTIKHYIPAVIGFQELQSGNLATYQEQLPEYHYVLGPEAGNEEPHDYNAIFWNSSLFELIDSGGFWLSKTPDKYSTDWSEGIRAATWVRFRCMNTNKQFLHINTHLDHISELARVEGSKVILQKIAQLQADDMPVFITGDFNCNPGSTAYSLFIEAGFGDTYLAAGNKDDGNSNTQHAYGGTKPSTAGQYSAFRRFDWILVGDSLHNVQIQSCIIVRDQEPPVYPSDHYPVLAEIIIGD